MARRKFFLGIFAIILASLACSSVNGGPNVQETVDAAVQATQQGGSGRVTSTETPDQLLSSPAATIDSVASPTLGSSDDQSSCDADKWRIIPVARWDQPSGAGLKNVLVQLAVQNNSSQWGEAKFFAIYQQPIFGTTEGGFTYPANIYTGGMIVGGDLLITPRVVPPGLVMGGGAWWNNPQYNAPLVLSFDVAESQKTLKITFPEVSIMCPTSDGKHTVVHIPLETEVNEDIYEPVDNSIAFEGFKSFDETLEIKDVGTIDFLDVTREAHAASGGELLTIRYKFTNASVGYQNTGGISGYLLGSDGVVHLSATTTAGNTAEGQFDVGPGLSSEEVMQFVVLNKPDQLALVIESVIAFNSNDNTPVYQIFKLP